MLKNVLLKNQKRFEFIPVDIAQRVSEDRERRVS